MMTNFEQMKATVTQMKVVNDCAEHGVALIQTYNSILTKNEDQKQFLLRLVAEHTNPTKAALQTVLSNTVLLQHCISTQLCKPKLNTELSDIITPAHPSAQMLAMLYFVAIM